MAKYKVQISLAMDVESPCNDEGGWQVYTFEDQNNDLVSDCNRERFFKPKNDGGYYPLLHVQSKLKAGTLFLMDIIEHSDRVFRLAADQKDFSRCSGVIVWVDEPKSLPAPFDGRKQKASWFLELYTEWAEGRCYDVEITNLETEEEVFAEANFIGSDSLFKSIRMALPNDATKDNVEFDDPFDMVRFARLFDKDGNVCPP